MTAARTTLTVIGAPSSAGAYAVGQEDAPAALRAAGLIEQLEAAGIDVADTGDTALQRWRPDRTSPRAQNAGLVVANAGAVRNRVTAALAGRRRALVLGGDCTTGLGTLAAAMTALDRCPSWLYVDLHPDLNTTRSVADGALDWTGMAHALGLPDTVPALCRLAGEPPTIAPGRIQLLGHDPGHATRWEREQIEQLGIRNVGRDELAADPPAAAERALANLDPAAEVVVHFDVDVVNFTDAPLSEHPGRESGVPLEAALDALATVMRDQRVCALTVTELNPHHAAADPEALPRFVAGLVRALAGTAGAQRIASPLSASNR